jgi:FLVCR family MFS transporter 7
MWQGCQTFGFLFVLIFDSLRDSSGEPNNNMYRALILQAALAGLMVILSFGFRGRMLRTEAIEKLKQIEENEKVSEEPQRCTCRIDDENDLERVSSRLE